MEPSPPKAVSSRHRTSRCRRQGNILAVGSSDDILNLAGSGTEKIDLDGRLVVPGFIDTHIHFL
jgi:predicted amidohydrolase YtcJ